MAENNLQLELGPHPTGQPSKLIGVQVIPVSVSVQALPGPHGLPYGLLQNSVLVVAMGVDVGALDGAIETVGAGDVVGGSTIAFVVIVVDKVDIVVDRVVVSI